MADWIYAQNDPDEELALLSSFSMKKQQPGGEVEFIITVREYVERNKQFMKFYAHADKQVNQKTGAITPFGWGETMLAALSECMAMIRRYPYEAEEGQP
jgi:hypothetical protein